MEYRQLLARMILDRDPTPTEMVNFNNLSDADLTARLERTTELLAQANTAREKELTKVGIPNERREVEFSKAWLLKLLDGPAPVKMIEYQDIHSDAPSESGTNFLRARHFPTGGVRLSVLKTPTGSRKAIRVTLKDYPVGKNLKLPAARKAAQGVVTAIEEGVNPNAKPEAVVETETLTLKLALDKFLADTTGLKASTIGNIERNVNKHMKPLLDVELASLVSADQILKVKNMAQKSCALNPHAGDGASGANNVVRTLRRLVKYHRALDVKGEIPEWPAERLKALGNVWVKDKPRKTRLEPEQFPEYMSTLKQQEENGADYFTLLLLTGCRKGELLGLTNGNIDVRAKSFTFVDPKNGHDHTLPVTDTIAEIFERRRAIVGFGKDNRLFRLDPRTTTDRIIRATTTEEVPGIKLTPHDCRRTFAHVARSRACGIPKDRIAALLNHVSGQTVTDDYAGDVDIEQMRADMLAIESRMKVLATGEQKQEATQ